MLLLALSPSSSSSQRQQQTLGLLILASVFLSGAAAFSWTWKRKRITGPNPNPTSSSTPTKWAATNLIHLKDFQLEEVLGDDFIPSPDGYTVFLGRFNWQAPTEKALIKLRPQQLPTTTKPTKPNTPTPNKTPSLLSLLSWMHLSITLESGAEYGYYLGKISPFRLFAAGVPLTYNIEIIAPASPRQITRARLEEKYMVRETGEMYIQALGPLIEDIRKEGKSIQWVYNILDKKKEAERIIYEDPDPAQGFLLVPDPKWKSHPNFATLSSSKQELKGHPCVQHLACLAIVHDRSLGSMRDLRRKHLPLLKNVLEAGLKTIKDVYGLDRASVRVFVHYVPQFFHFHVHFSRINLSHGIEVERAHLLEDIIDNIERNPPTHTHTDTDPPTKAKEYYETATISYSVKKSEEVFKRLQAAGYM